MLKDMYKSDRLKESFKEYFCGPDILPEKEYVLVAQYQPINEDGCFVNVYAQAWPAVFFKIDILKDGNVINTINTGSSMRDFVAELAYQFADGMLNIEQKQ